MSSVNCPGEGGLSYTRHDTYVSVALSTFLHQRTNSLFPCISEFRSLPLTQLRLLAICSPTPVLALLNLHSVCTFSFACILINDNSEILV